MNIENSYDELIIADIGGGFGNDLMPILKYYNDININVKGILFDLDFVRVIFYGLKKKTITHSKGKQKEKKPKQNKRLL